MTALLDEFRNPPREFSVLPFWFWNDTLDAAEIRRQIADFEAHGVYGFVIHPRVGLPRDTGWMSEKLLGFIRVAVDEAKARGLYVILYDEGMYPSGSSSGQVVAANPAHACRGLACVEVNGEAPVLKPGWTLLATVPRRNGQRVAIIDRPINSGIRGIHLIGEGPDEDEPPASDLLNPEAVRSFIHLVYDKFAAEFGAEFGTTIIGIFTDEPSLVGRCNEKRIQPGTTGILEHVNKFLGYDFTPHLPALWFDDEPDAKRFREDYHRALGFRLEQTYYRQLSEWCTKHNVFLTGHPGESDDIGLERYFHIPGQDLVWRRVLAHEVSAIEGKESTQGKCGSSAMVHLGRRRNSNECFGAYGHELTWDEMKALTDWCFVRGVNLLVPHAFYYSIRGCRKDERPPDVGPNSAWWGEYKAYADFCRRLSWLNTDCEHVCGISILGESDALPCCAAAACFAQQRDFNYLEARHLWEDARTDASGIRIAGQHYSALIVDGFERVPAQALPALEILANAGRLIVYGTKAANLPPRTVDTATPDALLSALGVLMRADVTVTPAQPKLRCRHVRKSGEDFYIFCHEATTALEFSVDVAARGKQTWLNPLTTREIPMDGPLRLAPCATMILRVVRE